MSSVFFRDRDPATMVETFDNSPAMKMAENYYHCLIPEQASRCEDHLRAYGTFSSGDSGIDEMMQNAWQERLLTIDQMVYFFDQNVPFSVIDEKDTLDIYLTSQKFLQGWIERMETCLNQCDPPVEKLEKVERFEKHLFGLAKYLLVAYPPVVTGLFEVAKDSPWADPWAPIAPVKTHAPVLPSRLPLGDQLNETLKHLRNSPLGLMRD